MVTSTIRRQKKHWNLFLLEKMACKNCFKDNEELSIQTTTTFKSCWSLVVFLWNVVLNIKDIWTCFCKFEKVSVYCLACQFRITYKNDEYDIYENSFNMDYLERFHPHVFRNLLKLLKTDSHLACELVNRQFFLYS